jgi:hypothetical protein
LPGLNTKASEKSEAFFFAYLRLDLAAPCALPTIAELGFQRRPLPRM